MAESQRKIAISRDGYEVEVAMREYPWDDRLLLTFDYSQSAGQFNTYEFEIDPDSNFHGDKLSIHNPRLKNDIYEKSDAVPWAIEAIKLHDLSVLWAILKSSKNVLQLSS